MVRRMFPCSAIVLCFLVSTSLAWSKNPAIPLAETDDEPISENSPSDIIPLSSDIIPAESKSRYKWRQGDEGRYILEEEPLDHEKGGHHLQKDEDDNEHDPGHQTKKAKISKVESLKPKLKSTKGRPSEKRYGLEKNNNGHLKVAAEKDKEYNNEDQTYHEENVKKSGIEPSESKLKSSRYKGRHSDGHYILNEDDHLKGGHGGKDEEFLEEEGNEGQDEEEHDRGYHNEDKKLEDENLKEYNIKGEDHEFKEASPSSSQNPRAKRAKKKITLSRLLNEICASQETCIEWLKNQGFIPKILFCSTCSRKMKFERDDSALDGFVWACKECRIEPPHHSTRHGSWLESRDASLADILLLSFLWAHGFSRAQMAKEANMDVQAVQQWDEMCVEICETLLKKSAKDGDGENSRKGCSKDSIISLWRKKNKNKDLFLEFLKDADSL